MPVMMRGRDGRVRPVEGTREEQFVRMCREHGVPYKLCEKENLPNVSCYAYKECSACIRYWQSKPV